MMKIALAGATGFIGKALIPHLLAQGHDVTVLTRSPVTGLPPEIHLAMWDPEKGPAPAAALDGMDAVIHLAGEPISQRWSNQVKKRIRDSRVDGTRNMVEGIAACERKPRALICGSAIGYYGDRADEILDESAKPGSGFLPEVCLEWEAAGREAEKHGLRVVFLRTGVVIGNGGGALDKMLPPFKFGVGGRLGSGEQWMSWIHIEDQVRLIAHAIETEAVRGALNGVAPNPVRNQEFTRALARAVQRPAIFPVPLFALKIIFGEMSQIMTASQRVIPKAALDSGFRFEHPEIYAALKDITG